MTRKSNALNKAIGRKLNAKNFGLKSSKIENALKNALLEKNDSFATIAAKMSHLKEFAGFLKESGIKDLRRLDRSDVLKFADHLIERYERGEISASTAQNKLSAVNTTLEQACLDKRFQVNPVSDAKMPKRTGIAAVDHSMSDVKHAELMLTLDDRTACLIDLQRSLGLRFKESALLNAKQAFKQAQVEWRVIIEDGTKGGRTRTVPITNVHQISVLERAAAIQSQDKRDYSMIPHEKNFKQFQSEMYKLAAKHSFNFHSERHSYANNRYERLMGAKSPVKAAVIHGKAHIAYLAQQLNISKFEASQRDKEVRLQIANELGHGRIDVTNSYLG